jgi:hypothetical protein
MLGNGGWRAVTVPKHVRCVELAPEYPLLGPALYGLSRLVAWPVTRW